MRRRAKRRSDLYAPYGTCPTCGWTGHDWGFYYHRSCTTCYDKWRRARSEKLRRAKPPNENIEIADGVVITKNVRAHLKKQAVHEVPRTSNEALCETAMVVSAMAVLVIGAALLWSLAGHREYTPALGISGVASCIAFYIAMWAEGREAKRRSVQVDARLAELAYERQRKIDETQAFYASAEWRLIRNEVIEEQGSICQHCRCHITTAYDLTVDHIKPRSEVLPVV